MTQIRTVVAIGLIVLGAMIMTGPMFGFSTIAGDRNVTVTTADDPNAHLGIEGVYSGQTITSGDAQSLIRLTNQFDQTLGGTDGTIDVEVINVSGDIQDNSSLAIDREPSQLDPGEGGNVDVICVDETIHGKNTVDVTLRVVEASGQSVSVTDATVDPVTNVEVQCSKTQNTQSGLTDVWVSDLDQGNQSETQTFEFTLTNDLIPGETVTVDYKDTTANQIDYSSATVSIRDGNGNGTVRFTDNMNRLFEYEASNGIVSQKTAIKIEITGIDTTDSKAGGTYDVEFQKENEQDAETAPFTVE